MPAPSEPFARRRGPDWKPLRWNLLDDVIRGTLSLKIGREKDTSILPFMVLAYLFYIWRSYLLEVFGQFMRLLFVCVGNSCRSQIAEAIANDLGHYASSAGTDPEQNVSRNAIEVLDEMGVDSSGLFPKSIDSIESMDSIE